MRFRFAAVRDAFTPEFRHPENKLVWLLRGLLAALAVYSLAVEPEFTTRPLLFFSAAIGLAASVGFAFVPTRRPRTLKAAEAATLVSIAWHVIGHAFGIYAAWKAYDTILHFIVPLTTVLVLYALTQATNWIWDWRRVSPLEVGIYLFSMALALSTCWEILEFGMDQLFGTREQDDLYDTMVDLIMDFSGALLGAIAAGYVTWLGREKVGLEGVSETPKRPVPTRRPTRDG